MMDQNIRQMLDNLQQDIEISREKTEARAEHYHEKKESLADHNRKAWVYGLADRGGIRYVGVSFYPEYQKGVMGRRSDDVGAWIRETDPYIILMEEVSPEDRALRATWWRRQYQKSLIKRQKREGSDELIAKVEDQIRMLTPEAAQEEADARLDRETDR